MLYFYWYLYVLLWLFALFAFGLSLKVQNRFLAFYCALWAFVFGFRRHDVGNDTPSYAAYFENVGVGMGYGTVDKPYDTAEEGFVFISRIINLFTNSPTIIFLLVSVTLWLLIYLLYKNISKTPLLALLFMMTITGRMFYTLEIAVRQTFSIIIILSGLFLIRNSGITRWRDLHKNKMAIVGVILLVFSVTVHRTTGALVAVMILLYFIYLNKTIAYILIAIFTIIAIFGAEQFAIVFDRTMFLMGDSTDETLNLLGNRYIGHVETAKIGIVSMFGWLIPSILTIYLTEEKKVNSFFFKMFIFSFCLHMLMQFSNIHERITTLFILVGFTTSIPDI